MSTAADWFTPEIAPALVVPDAPFPGSPLFVEIVGAHPHLVEDLAAIPAADCEPVTVLLPVVR